MDLSDRGIYEAECVLIALGVSIYLLWLALAALRRGRPDLRLAKPIATAFAVRVLSAAALSQLSIAQSLRGGDETTFLHRARDVAAEPLASAASTDKLTSELHTFLFSLNMRLFGADPAELMLRIEMTTLSVLGILFVAAAVYELAGPRAAWIAAWVLAFEPANVFFSTLLHKEPLMFMAEGAVAYGGATLWKRGSLTALVPIVFGCLVATATRPYAGWFLAAAACTVVLHASITRQQGFRALVLSVAMVALIVAFVPVVWNASSEKSLSSLQASQDANAADRQANLSLERVDYSTREKLITNLPKRIRDVVFKPYPWQAQNTSQRLGILGTLVVLVTLAFVIAALTRSGGLFMKRAGPLIYPAAFMLIAYSLSAGNAGTAYRYRTHVVALGLGIVVALYHQRRQEQVVDTQNQPEMWHTFRPAPTLAASDPGRVRSL